MCSHLNRGQGGLDRISATKKVGGARRSSNSRPRCKQSISCQRGGLRNNTNICQYIHTVCSEWLRSAASAFRRLFDVLHVASAVRDLRGDRLGCIRGSIIDDGDHRRGILLAGACIVGASVSWLELLVFLAYSSSCSSCSSVCQQIWDTGAVCLSSDLGETVDNTQGCGCPILACSC